MKIPYILFAVFFLIGNHCYGQTIKQRHPICVVHNEPIDIYNLSLKEYGTLIFAKLPEELSVDKRIYIDGSPLYKQPAHRNYMDIEESITALRTPRRDITAFVLNTGGVIEKPNGGFSILGSRNEPLMFVDGVKTRGKAILPVASISAVEVIKGGIPAEFGDTNSGIIFISSLGN